MSLGETIEFTGGSYEIRAIVDGRYVVRIRYRRRNIQTYEIWTSDEREQFDRKQEQRRLREERQRDLNDRNQQIYERNLAGEKYTSLSREFRISPSRVSSICSRRARHERGIPRRDELSPDPTAQDRFSATSDEWEQAKPPPIEIVSLQCP
jgi:hypothetical protein